MYKAPITPYEVFVTLFCLRDRFAIPGAVEAIGASYIPFDLHVLGTPPAFVLSQDQTLEFNLLNASQRFAHFLSLGRVFYFRVRNSLISRSELTWLVVDALYSFQGASLSGFFRDSFVSISHPFPFVNTFFHFFSFFFLKCFLASLPFPNSNAADITPFTPSCQPPFYNISFRSNVCFG